MRSTTLTLLEGLSAAAGWLAVYLWTARRGRSTEQVCGSGDLATTTRVVMASARLTTCDCCRNQMLDTLRVLRAAAVLLPADERQRPTYLRLNQNLLSSCGRICHEQQSADQASALQDEVISFARELKSTTSVAAGRRR